MAIAPTLPPSNHVAPTIIHGTQAAFPPGQRLKCDHCGAQIEIIKACSCQPPDQILQCCGKDMRPAS